MNAIAARINAYERLMRLHRPIGILLLLWPTLWALWLGERGWPNPAILLLFVTGTVLMRSGGCAINDFADRNFDASVERTRDRRPDLLSADQRVELERDPSARR